MQKLKELEAEVNWQLSIVDIAGFTESTVLLWQKFMPPSGPKIARVAEIYSLLVYLLGEKANHYP